MQIILVLSLLLASLNAQIHTPHEWDDVRGCNHDENSYYCQSNESCVTDNTNSDYVAFMDVDSGSAECENCVLEQIREDGADCGWNQADSKGQRAGAPKGENTREECLNECYLDPDCTHASFHERQKLCHFFTKCTIEATNTIRWDVYRKVCPRVESEQDEEGSDDIVRPDEGEEEEASDTGSRRPPTGTNTGGQLGKAVNSISCTPGTDFPCGTALLGDVALTTVDKAGYYSGENIFGPFEAGFSSQHDDNLISKGCEDPSDGYSDGGMDTKTVELILAESCDITLSRYEPNADQISDADWRGLLNSCGEHHNEIHFHENMSCLWDNVEGEHSPTFANALDGKPLYGKYEVYSDTNPQLPVLDACGGHWGPVPGVEGEIYHYHVQDDAPFSIGCFGPNEDGTEVTVEQCRDLYSTCLEGEDETHTLYGEDFLYRPYCPCFDGAGSNTGDITPLVLFSTALPETTTTSTEAICNGTEDLCMSYFAYEDMNCGEMNIMESFEAPVNLHKCMDMEDMQERATSIMFSCYMPGVLEKVEFTGTGCTGRGQSTMLSLDECSQDEGGMHTITWIGACLESEDSKEPEGSEREVERPDESEDSEESEDSSKDSEEPEPEGSEKEVEGHDDDLCREYEAMCAKDCPAVPEDNDNKKDVLRVRHGVCVALEGFGSMRVDCDRMGGTATIRVGADCQENVETVRTGGVFCNYETIGATFICEDDYVEIGHCADVTVSMHYQTSEDCNDVVQVENMALDLDECVDGMMCTCGGDDGVVCGSCEEDSVENAMEEHRYVDGEMERLNNGLVVRTRVEGACKDYPKKEDGSDQGSAQGSAQGSDQGSAQGSAQGSDADMGCNERTDACVTITDYLDTCEYGAVLGAETLSVVFGECQTYDSNTYIQWECMDGEIVGHTYTDALCREETNKYMSLEYGVCIEGENREFYEAVWSGTCMPSQGSDEGSAQGSDQGSAQGSDQGSAQGSEQGSAQGSDQGSAQGSDQGSAQGSDQGTAPETTTPYVEPETTTPAPETTTPYVEPETTTPAPETTTSYVEPETTTPAQGSDQGSAQGSDQGSAQGSAQGSGVDIDELPCVGDEYRDADGMCQLCADHVCPEAGTSPHCENEVVTCVKDAVPTTTVCKMVEVEGRENECAWDEEDKPGRYSPGGKAWSLEDCNDLCVDRDNCSHSAFGGNGNNKDLARCHIFQTCTGTGWHNYVVWEKVCEVVELTPRPTPEPTTRPPTPPPTTVAQCFELKTDLLESRECVWTGQTRDDSMNNATEQNCINLCHSSSSCTHYSYHNKQSRCHTFKSCDGEGEPNSIRWETHTNVCNPANL